MENKVKLGFCPTMTPYAEGFDKNIDDIELVRVPGAAGVMNMLLAGAIDAALIGREAYKRELNDNIKKKRLKGGYTLVYKDKIGIPKEKLKEISIKTYLPKNIVSDLLPNIGNITFYTSIEECEKENMDMPMLIDWKDFKDEHEMLIPQEANGMKTPIYRAPVIFYNKEIEEFVNSNLNKTYTE